MMKIKPHIGLSLLFAVIVLIVIVFFSSRFFNDAVITWTPYSVSETILLGTSKTTSVSFVASKNIDNVVVQVVPELDSYVEANASAFASIPKGQAFNFDLIISVPIDVQTGTFYRTVHLMSSDNPGKTLARPLPIIITVSELPSDLKPFDETNVLEDPETNQEIVCNEVLVSFRDGVSVEDIIDITESVDGTIVGRIPEIGLFQIELNGVCDSSVVKNVVNILNADLRVEQANENFLAQPFIPAL